MRRQSIEKTSSNKSSSKESVKRSSNQLLTNSPRISRESMRRSLTDNVTRVSPLVSRESLRRSSTKVESGAKLTPRNSKIASKSNIHSPYRRLPSQKSGLEKRSPSTRSMQAP